MINIEKSGNKFGIECCNSCRKISKPIYSITATTGGFPHFLDLCPDCYRVLKKKIAGDTDA
jgi:hypothetical protein